MIYNNKQMEVDLSNGHLDKIKNYKLEDITELNISYNKLKQLPKWINKCINLQRLCCRYNQLTRLSRNLPTSLQELDFSGNQLIQLPKNLPVTLHELYCKNNQLTLLPVSLPSSLQWLDCSYNQLTLLPESLPSSLQWLDCSYNQLTSLPISILDCRSLIEINYNDNEIENIHPAITRFINRIQNRNRQSVYNC
jgi:Leucine-rich repeat (LRR) protein